jgi:large subunit ribosomal protein L31
LKLFGYTLVFIQEMHYNVEFNLLSGVIKMKKNTHPEYQSVVFEDSSTGARFVCGTTLRTKETTMHDGKEYPLCRVSVSSSSHPFFTGSKGNVDAEGRIEKFKKRYATQAKPVPHKKKG